ncbi:MAG: dephospho-CoA kinase [Magnetococcales bacterium]|nr:dephospho-CoA kinase [Magnetococcales bacterium]
MYLLGLTGSMGCGKSTVAAHFKLLGAHLLDSDRLARDVVAPGSEGLAALVGRFGASVLNVDGALDRKRLGKVVFGDDAKRRDLEALIHPRIRRMQMEALARWCREDSRSLVVLDIPLLFETGAETRCDGVVVTSCGAVQEARLDARGGMAPEVRRAVVARQMSEAEKCRRADWVIDNSGERAATLHRVERLWTHLVVLAKSGGGKAWPGRWQEA